MELVGIVGWILLGVAAAWVAQSKGRSFVGWLVLGLLLPIIGLVVALVVPRIEANVDARAIAGGARKRCPYCAELIRAEARVCRFCGRDLAAGRAANVDADTIASIEASRIERDRQQH